MDARIREMAFRRVGTSRGAGGAPFEAVFDLPGGRSFANFEGAVGFDC